MSWFKKYFPIIYVVIGLSTFFYVRGILSQDVIMIDKASDNKKVVKDVKPVDVKLTILGFGQNTSYNRRKENDESFDDFLEDLVDNADFLYEKTEYIYGTVYDKINGEVAPEGYVWRVYADEDEFTYNTKGLKLVDGVNYKFFLDKK